jgi:hypothetical protein
MKQLIPNANFDRTLHVGTPWQMDLPLPTRLPPQMSGALMSALADETLPENWCAQSHSAPNRPPQLPLSQTVPTSRTPGSASSPEPENK